MEENNLEPKEDINPDLEKKLADYKQQKTAKAAKESYEGFVVSLTRYLRELLNLNLGADKTATITRIQGDIDFKGAAVWILIASIFVASIGLNVNSTAVVIGAMLISPLMGPILGIGLSVGINDWATLKRSLRNFGIATFISILTATLFFYITPFKELTSELGGRTAPNLYDAFIAFFGGIAGIIGVSRKEKTNVIPGVAIATALMPPLCTAGYGIAIGEWDYFLGAFYLYFLNAFFIAIATYIVVRVLNIPTTTFVDPKKEKVFKRYIYVSAILILIPAGYLFWGVAQKSVKESTVKQFITENVKFDGVSIANQKIFHEGDLMIAEVILFGDPVPKSVVNNWINKLSKEYPIEEAELRIVQRKDLSLDINEFKGKLESVKADLYKDLKEKAEAELEKKEKELTAIQEELKVYKNKELPAEDLHEEMQILQPNLSRLYVGAMSEFIDGDVLEIPTFIVELDNEDPEQLPYIKTKLEEWLAKRLKKKKIHVILSNNL
jgi:uncharacterized hydrophobic protein (TIGR00271 family)